MENKTQRFRKLLENDLPQGEFLFRPILMHFAARYHGITYGELASDYRKLVEANIHCMEAFDTDMVGLISDPYRETAAFGAPVRFVPDGVPVCEQLIVKTIDDIRALPRPDLYAAARTRDRIKGAGYYQELLKGTVPVIGWVEGPLAEACDLARVSEILMKLMIDPGFVELLLDRCLQTGIDFAEAQVNEGCDIIGIGDAICSQIDPVMYTTYVKERHRSLIGAIHDKGAKVKMHICGDITHLLPELADLQIDILDIDWQVDPGEAHRIMGPGVIRCGNINPLLIQDLQAEDLYHRAEQLLDAGLNRKFILSGGCEITPFTPPENLLALAKASKKKPL